MKKLFAYCTTLIFPTLLFSQNNFSGDVEVHADFYVRDTGVHASNTPHYEI